jgi:hypothetical protein
MVMLLVVWLAPKKVDLKVATKVVLMAAMKGSWKVGVLAVLKVAELARRSAATWAAA